MQIHICNALCSHYANRCPHAVESKYCSYICIVYSKAPNSGHFHGLENALRIHGVSCIAHFKIYDSYQFSSNQFGICWKNRINITNRYSFCILFGILPKNLIEFFCAKIFFNKNLKCSQFLG